MSAEVQHATVVAGEAVIAAKFMRCGSTGIEVSVYSPDSTRDPLVMSAHLSTKVIHDLADAFTRMATLLDQNKEVAS
jgi:ABC-type phosphate/phosphonate transport system substrate-binding protein